MRIAIDGMGGDNAPQAVINGVIQALNEYNDLEFIYWPRRHYKRTVN